MILRSILIAGFFLSVLFAIHFFVFKSITYFFNITGYQSKIILAVSMTSLTLLFILSLVLTHVLKGYFSHFIYTLGSTWIGLGAHLLVLFMASWIVFLVGKGFGLAVNGKILGFTVIIASIFLSIYGLINAQNVKIKQITVQIPNLPEFWKGKNIVQISDAHLGAVNNIDFLKEIIQKTNELHPTIVVITGDLFDGSDSHFESFKVLLNEIKAPQGVYFITGNHEVYLGVEKVFDLLEQTHIKALSNESIDINGLQLLGINFPDIKEKQDIKAIAKEDPNFTSGKPTILLHHVPTNIAQAKELGVNLQLSGHTHRGQIYPLNYITKLVFKKYAYGLHQEGTFTIYTTPGAGTWGPPMRTGHHPEIVNITLE